VINLYSLILESSLEKAILVGLFKMHIMTIVNMKKKKENNITSSSYLLESCDMWRDKLCHMNYNSIKILINLDLLPSVIFL
jgi:hypothetical protein